MLALISGHLHVGKCLLYVFVPSGTSGGQWFSGFDSHTSTKLNPIKKIMDITGLIIVAIVAITVVGYKYSQSFRDFVEFLDGLEEANQNKIKEEKE